MSSITGSTKGSPESSGVRVLRNDEIGFGGSGSTTNIFIFGVLKNHLLLDLGVGIMVLCLLFSERVQSVTYFGVLVAMLPSMLH